MIHCSPELFYSEPQLAHISKMRSQILTLLSYLLVCSSQAQVQLVTSDEASRPDQQITSTRAISRGPSIKLLSNSSVDAKAFQFKVAMEPKGGAQLDNHSFKIEYLKNPPVELTERLKFAFSGNQLTIPVASVPKGVHTFKVSVKDTDGREGHSIISLEAK